MEVGIDSFAAADLGNDTGIASSSARSTKGWITFNRVCC